MGADGILHVMIGFGTSAGIFATSGAFFVATSLDSSDSQKKEYSEVGFGCRDTGDVVIFDGEATSFISSSSGFQKKTDRKRLSFFPQLLNSKKKRSETGFECRDTGDVENFIGESKATSLVELELSGKVLYR